MVAEEDAAHCWDPEERGCASSAIFVIFGLWVVVWRSHPRAVFAGKQFLPPFSQCAGACNTFKEPAGGLWGILNKASYLLRSSSSHDHGWGGGRRRRQRDDNGKGLAHSLWRDKFERLWLHMRIAMVAIANVNNV